jgi:hypothetical protein
MKKFNIMVAVAIALPSLFITSCKDDDDPEIVKTLSAIVTSVPYPLDRDSLVFDYDNEILTEVTSYRVVDGVATKKASTEFQYTNGKLIKIISYTWSGNTRTNSDKDSLFYDEENHTVKEIDFYVDQNKNFVINGAYITATYSGDRLDKLSYSSSEYSTPEYSHGNVVKWEHYFQNKLRSTDTYTFDNKKNPLKGNYYFYFNDDRTAFLSPNNYLSYQNGEDNYTETRAIEYDADGYPVKVTMTRKQGDADPETTFYKMYYK